MKALAPLWIYMIAIGSPAQEQPKNLKIFPKDSSRREIVNTMRTWSADLGARCDFCHWGPTKKFDDIQFDSDKKETKKTARKMYKMMTQINETFFAESDTKISCYTCHHGTTDPRKLDDILMEAYAEGGYQRLDETYRKIRKKYHGLGSYNFAPWVGIATVAGKLGAEKKYAESSLLHKLNLEFNPDYDFSHYALGVHNLMDTSDLEKARAHFKSAMEGNDFWTPRRMVGLAQKLKKQNRNKQRKQALEILLELAPGHADGHCEMGNLLLDLGDEAGAREAFQTALEKQPGHEAATKALAEL